MLDNLFRLTVDVLFPEPTNIRKRTSVDAGNENKFELIFHELVDGAQLLEELGDQGDVLLEDDPCLVEISDDEDEDQESDPEEQGF